MLWVAVLGTTSFGTKAEGFDVFGDHQKLPNQTIVASGNISEFSRGFTSLGAGTTQEVVYQVGQFCFASSEDISGKAGLLLIDQFSTISVATFSSSITSIKVNVSSATLLDCVQVIKRDTENIQRDFNRLQQQIEIDQKKNKAMIELLKKQQQSLKRSQ
jgi:arginine decarboxylase-like protein